MLNITYMCVISFSMFFLIFLFTTIQNRSSSELTNKYLDIPDSKNKSEQSNLSLGYKSNPGYLTLKLAFLHMRKSGGTHVNKLLTEMMIGHDCINKSEKVGTRGIKNGIPLDMLDPIYHMNYSEPSRCPKIQMIHEEILSLDGLLMLKIPDRLNRKDKSYTLLTTLRHPIERIGSQAFYGRYSVAKTVVSELIIHSNDKNCLHYKTQIINNKGFNPVTEAESCEENILKAKFRKDICECFTKVMNTTRFIIKSNESVWFNWINNVVGYQDNYLPNYFIKRLVARTKMPKYPNTKYEKSLNCISIEECRNYDPYQILMDSFLLTEGPGYKDPMKKFRVPDDYDIKTALNISKQLLEFKFDFIILENFNQPRSRVALEKALHNTLLSSKKLFQNNDNKGIFNPTKSLIPTVRFKSDVNMVSKTKSKRRRLQSVYANNIPLNVLNYLIKDNSEDIELYNFALKEFDRRTREESWNNI